MSDRFIPPGRASTEWMKRYIETRERAFARMLDETSISFNKVIAGMGAPPRSIGPLPGYGVPNFYPPIRPTSPSPEDDAIDERIRRAERGPCYVCARHRTGFEP